MILSFCGGFENAGDVPYGLWAAEGVQIPIFIEKGTLIHPDTGELITEVADGLNDIGSAFNKIGLLTDQEHLDQVREASSTIATALGVAVFNVGLDRDYRNAADLSTATEIGLRFGVDPRNLGLVGSRNLIDQQFGERMGAQALAICRTPEVEELELQTNAITLTNPQ